MSFPEKIIDFLIDEKKRISTKATFIFLGIVALVLIDNVVGFSYNYKVDKELSQIQQLNQIIKDSISDSITKSHALFLRKEIIERKNIIEKTFEYCSTLEWQKKTEAKTKVSKEIIKKPVQRSKFWFHATAGGFFYLIAIIILPIMIFFDRSSPFFERLATGILAILVFSGLGFFFYWICNFIPQIINSSWIINYIINVIIQSSIVLLTIKSNDKK